MREARKYGTVHEFAVYIPLKFASANPKFPIHLFPIPTFGNHRSVLFVSLCQFHRYVHLCHILDSTYK